MEEWLRKGIEDWKKNMLIKKERERKTLEFEYTQADKYKTYTLKQVEKGTQEVEAGIDDFEQTLRKEGIKPHIDSEDEEEGETFQRRQHQQRRKKKDTGISHEAARKARERRRRKMIHDQSQTLGELESERREFQLVDRMKRQSKQEEELSYEVWRTQECKNVVIENRKLRDARYERRKELDA